jgi:protein ImuB
VTDAASAKDRRDPQDRHDPQNRRYLALWFPFLPTDRLRPGKQETSEGPAEPRALIEKQQGALRLAAVDARAVELGLVPGLTLADARARVPDLLVADHDPLADADFLQRLADGCCRYTPLVAVRGADGLVLDITGCAHLFGGEAPLARDIFARLSRRKLAARCAIAGTPDAAFALARHGRQGAVPAGEEAQAVSGLPLRALGVAPEIVTALQRAGLKTIADLASRPRAPLAARFGDDLLARLDRTLGRIDIRITPHRAAPACIVERCFPEPIARSEDFEAALDMLLGKAVRILEERGEGGRNFEASFFRTDGRVRYIVVETGRPSRDRKSLMRLYREKLDSLADPIDPGFGFDLIRLAILHAETLDAAQTSLDGRQMQEEEIAALIERLSARFGRDRVLRYAPQDTHDPQREASLRPAVEARPETASWREPLPDDPPARPLHLFEPPQPIETLAEVPDGPPLRFRWRRVMHEIARAEGPERIAPEWWRRDAATRDYYRVEDSSGHRFWVFRDGLYGRDAERPRWFMHGLFA